MLWPNMNSFYFVGLIGSVFFYFPFLHPLSPPLIAFHQVYLILLSRQEYCQPFIRCFGPLLKWLLPRGVKALVSILQNFGVERDFPCWKCWCVTCYLLQLDTFWPGLLGGGILTMVNASFFPPTTNSSHSTLTLLAFISSFLSDACPSFLQTLICCSLSPYSPPWGFGWEFQTHTGSASSSLTAGETETDGWVEF